MTRKPKNSESTAGDFADAFPSSPRRPPVIGIYITHDDKPGAINYVSFSQHYSAAAFIQDCIEVHGRPDAITTPALYSGKGTDLVFEPGWRLSTRCNSDLNDLEQLVKYKFTAKEADFTIPDDIKQRFAILGGKKDKPLEQLPDDARQGTTSSNKANNKPDGSSKKKVLRPDGLITLASFAPDAGEARRLLRSNNFPKPDHGQWAWPANSSDLAKVKKLLKIG